MGIFRRRQGWIPNPATPLKFTLIRYVVIAIVIAILWLTGQAWLIPWVTPWLQQSQPGLDPAPVSTAAVAQFERPIMQGAPPPDVLMGWKGEKVAQAAMARLQPRVYSCAPGEYTAIASKRVILWSPMREVNRGRDPPNIPQPVGDCVSRGWSHGCEYSLAAKLILTGQGRFARIYPPYIYGGARVTIGGGGISGDGAVGAWAAKFVERHGAVEWVEGLRYDAETIRAWGRNGPSKEALEQGKKHLAQVRLIIDFESACVALSHGGAIPICSNVGFERIVAVHDRIEGQASGTWNHCMCAIGFDTRPGLEALYILNSWGPNAHARAEEYAKLDAAPPGGFWVSKATVERMLRQQDSYAVFFGGFDQQSVLDHFSLAP